jgi:hypothetical protein
MHFFAMEIVYLAFQFGLFGAPSGIIYREDRLM